MKCSLFSGKIQFILRRAKFSTSLNGLHITSQSSPTDIVLAHRLESWPGKFRTCVNFLVSDISVDNDLYELVKAKDISRTSWDSFITVKLRRRLMKDPLTIIRDSPTFLNLCQTLEKIALKGDTEEDIVLAKATDEYKECKLLLFQDMLAAGEIELAAAISLHRALISTSDLREPAMWYPLARMSKRKIIFHGGPTNSGKTYHALQRLKQADRSLGGGLYCGPLRLLALEIYDRLNREGILTSLLTGQERSDVPGSWVKASTVEMINLRDEYDVVVIDEIQMIADKQRGYAWSDNTRFRITFRLRYNCSCSCSCTNLFMFMLIILILLLIIVMIYHMTEGLARFLASEPERCMYVEAWKQKRSCVVSRKAARTTTRSSSTSVSPLSGDHNLSLFGTLITSFHTHTIL
jgi:hypothetical protein